MSHRSRRKDLRFSTKGSKEGWCDSVFIIRPAESTDHHETRLMLYGPE